jgi:hypothetical protein
VLRAGELRACLTDTAAVLAQRRPAWVRQPPAGGTGLWIDTGGKRSPWPNTRAGKGVRLLAGPAFSAFKGFSRHLRLPYWHEACVLVEALHRLDEHRGVG